MSLPSPRPVARRSLLEPRLPAYQNARTCVFPAYCEFSGFLQYPNLELCLEETLTGGAMQNEDPLSLEKKLIIFYRSGNKTRVFYSPVFPLDQSLVSAATELGQVCDDLNEGQEIDMVKSYSNKYGLPKEYNESHMVDEESEMHEDTEEINALLYSDDDVENYIDDDDDDEVKSTGHSPIMPTGRIYLMNEHSEDTKEEICSSNWPIKRQKLNDGERRSSSPMDESCDNASDAESNYVSNRMCSAEQSLQEVKYSMVSDIQMKKIKYMNL